MTGKVKYAEKWTLNQMKNNLLSPMFGQMVNINKGKFAAMHWLDHFKWELIMNRMEGLPVL